MKATIDIPDDLYRQVKAKAALEGNTVREVTTALYRAWVQGTYVDASRGDAEQWLEEWVQLGQHMLGNAPGQPTLRDIIDEDRGRLDPDQSSRSAP